MKEETQDDEISLIDLFVVLLKRWRLIVSITLIAVLSSFVWVFLIPQPMVPVVYEGKMTVTLNPVAAMLAPVDLVSVFNRPELVFSAFGDTGLAILELNGAAVSLDGKTEQSAVLSFIENNMIQDRKNFSVIPVVGGNSLPVQTANTANIMFRYEDPDIVRSFLEALLKRGNAAAGEFMRPFMEAFIVDYEAFMASDGLALNKSLSLDEVRQYNFSKTVLAGKEKIVVELPPPLLVTENTSTVLPSGQKGKLVKFFVVVLAAFFFSVFLAFCLNALDNLKKDRKTLNKLRDALGKKGGQS
jgi:hypothetical protein